MSELTPQRIGKYIIESPLGQGAMGVVYKGLDPHIERDVAIKVIRKAAFDDHELEGALVRFQREAQAAGRLLHPNIVMVYEYGEENETAYIAMEFVEGQTFKEIFAKRQRLPLSEVGTLFSQLLQGLGAAHEYGVVHRDIKPANVLVNGRDQVKIMDFGIARVESSSLTMAGTVVGTPSYMAPELINGEQADKRCDLFAAGVILYQMLTGEKPFAGESMTAIMNKVVNVEPAMPSELVAGLPPELDGVVSKALAKRVEDRFQSAAEFSAALEQALGKIGTGALAGAPAQAMADEPTLCFAAQSPKESSPAEDVATNDSRQGKKGLVAALLAMVLTLVALALYFWLQPAQKDVPEPPPAQPQPVTQVPLSEEQAAGLSESADSAEQAGAPVASPSEPDSEPQPHADQAGEPAPPAVEPAPQPGQGDGVLPREPEAEVVPASPESVPEKVATPVTSPEPQKIPVAQPQQLQSQVTFMPESMIPREKQQEPEPVSQPEQPGAASPSLGSELPGTAPFQQDAGVTPGRLLREDEW